MLDRADMGSARAGWFVISCGMLLACRAQREDVTPSSASASASGSAPSTTAAATASARLDGRELPAAATFGDLISVASKKPGSAAGAGCNLRRGADGGHRFEGVVGSDEIGPAPEDLDAALMKSDAGVRVTTAYGLLGSGTGLVLRPLAPLPRVVVSSTLPALFVTDKGVYVRLTMEPGMRVGGDHGPIPEADVERVRRELAPRAAAILVAAEAGVKLDRLRTVLSWLRDATGPVVLATPLAKGTQPPAAAVVAKRFSGEGACPRGGLGDIPKGSTVGEYDTQAFFDVTEVYRTHASACGASLPETSAGGKVKVQLRIEPDGSVSKACIENDDTADAALRKCVIDRTRAYRFPKPETPGIVNFGTEIAFTPARFSTKALCD